MKSKALGFLVVVMAASSVASAQTPIFASTSVPIFAGDFTGDGIPDFRRQLTSNVADVDFLSGYNFLPLPMPYPASSITVVGDLDGDGVRDLIVLSTSLTTTSGIYNVAVRGYSYVTAQTLFLEVLGQVASYSPAARVVDLHDVDGDGIDDFALLVDAAVGPIGGSAPGTHFDGYIRVFSGATRQQVYFETVPAVPTLLPNNYTVYPATVGPLGDGDGDGHADFWTRTTTALQQPATLTLRRGPSGIAAFTVNSNFIRASEFDDVDGDGFDDVLYWDAGGTGFPSSTMIVAVLRGSDFEPLTSFVGSVASVSLSTAVLDDIDQDGAKDIGVVGFSTPTSGTVARIFSGRTGALILQHPGLASAIFAAGDVNLDGWGDYTFRPLALSDPPTIWSPRSNHVVAAATPFGTDYISVVGAPTLMSTAPKFGQTIMIATTAPGPGYGVLMIGPRRFEPYTVFGGLGFSVPMAIWVDLAAVSAVGLDANLGPTSNFQSVTPIIPLAEGMTIVLQAGYWPTAGGFFASNAVELRLGY